MKVLVLDNDLIDRTLIQHVLQQNSHEIVTAEDSDTAMRLLQEEGIRFVMADRASTDIDDKQFIARVRAAEPASYIYILLLTSKVQETDIASPRTGADDYLQRPLVPLELKARLQIGERILNMGDELLVARDTLERVAMYDTLTATLNQKAFLTFSGSELERARRAQWPLSLIALVVDNFQALIEKYGENISNDVLRIIAKSIREKSRPYDGLGRYGTDTFLISLPGVIGQDAEKIADRILKGVLNTDISLLDGREVKVGISAGVICVTRITVATGIETLIEQAQEAVGNARREGGNRSNLVFI
jgi:two-component system chemotaxis response regulator CheY